MQNLGFILIYCLIAPFGFLPLRWSQAIGSCLGLFLIRYNKKRARIALCNIQACFPEKTSQEHQEMVRKIAMETGKWFLECSYVWFRSPKSMIKRIEVTNPEVFDQAYNKGRGVVVVLPHLGNWEALNFYLPLRYPMGSMYKPAKSPLFEKIIFDSRSRSGIEMYPTDASGIRKALKALKQKKVLAILSDHLPSQKAGVYAPFFGIPALTGKFTHTLVSNNQAEVVLAAVIRKPKGAGFAITFTSIDGMHTDDSVAAATAMNKAIEDSIMLAPEQYQWVYRRFAQPPEGTPSIYENSPSTNS